MKNLTCNSNEESSEKFSKKRVNLIINRIKNLEDDIREIKGRQISNNHLIDTNLKKLSNRKLNDKTMNFNPATDLRETNFINHTMITNSSKQNRNSKKKNGNDNNSNNSFLIQSEIKDNKFKTRLKKNDSRLMGENMFKKINIYHNNIHEKKNILFKNNSIYAKNKLRNKTRDNNNNNDRIECKKEFIKKPSRNIQDKNKKSKNYFEKNLSLNNFNNISSPKITFFSFDEIDKENKPKLNEFSEKESEDNNNNNDSNIEYFLKNNNSNFENNCLNKNQKQIQNLRNNISTNITNNKNYKNMSQLEYEFEERHLLKKLKLLKNKNKEMLNKFNLIKKENITIENNLLEQKNYQRNLINTIVQSLKDNNINSNGYKSLETNDNISTEINFKDVLLNLMEIKYDYENNLMTNQFIKGVSDLLRINIEDNNNDTSLESEYHKYDFNIMKKINELIDMKNNLSNTNNKYRYLCEQNKIYYKFCINLLNSLHLENLNELELFIQDIFIKNIKENERMKKIKDALINDNCNYPLSLNEKLYTSKIKPFSASSSNYNNNKKMSYKQLQRYLIENNNDKKQLLNNTNYSNLNNFDLYSCYKNTKMNNSINNSINNNAKYQSVLCEKRSQYENSFKGLSDFQLIPKKENSMNFKVFNINKENNINIENENVRNRNRKRIMLMKPTYNNGIRDIFSQFINQRNLMKNDDDINCCKNNKKGKRLTFNNCSIKHMKHNSAYDIGFFK